MSYVSRTSSDMQEGLLFLLLEWVVHMVCYWIPALLWELRPHAKTSASLNKVAPTVLHNQILLTPLVTPLMLAVTHGLELRTDIGVAPVVLQLVAIVVLHDVWFALLHWAVHANCMRLHKQHHRLAVPNAAGALYASPAEHLLVNTAPTALSLGTMRFIFHTCGLEPPLLAAHLLFVALGTWNTVLAHTPGTRHARHHGKEHDALFGNFPYVMDVFIEWFRAGVARRMHARQDPFARIV